MRSVGRRIERLVGVLAGQYDNRSGLEIDRSFGVFSKLSIELHFVLSKSLEGD
jgi:hypothetical protein